MNEDPVIRPMRTAVFTSTDIRHRHFASAIRKVTDVVAVCYEQTGYEPASTARAEIDEATRRVLDDHFAERRRQEQRYFGHDAALVPDGADCGVRKVDRRTLNSAKTVEFLRQRSVETVVVFGTDLIKPPLLDAFRGRFVNLHLGLSPYYRGTATNFYPLLNDEPEYVGATIHLIDPGIDTGPVLHHARPAIVADDRPHTVGCKAILAGIEKMIQALHEIETGTAEAVPQWPVSDAKVCLRKDYHPRQVVRLYEMVEAGLFPRYVERAPRVAGKIRLVS